MSPLIKQLLKFGLVGSINTSIDFAVFSLLIYWGLRHLPAQGVSFTCGVLNSFFLNRSWTFRARQGGKGQFVRFVSLNILVLLVSLVLLAGLEGLGLTLWISKIGTTGLGVLFNYLGSRLWVFTDSSLTRRGEV